MPENYGKDWLNQAVRFAAVRALGFSPQRILDIGAYHGHWCGLARHIWPQAEIQMIEANPDCEHVLNKKAAEIHVLPPIIAVLDSVSRNTFYHKCQTGCGEGNGLFKENSSAPFQSVPVRTETLDKVCKGILYDFIKLDCQGAEVSILRGGANTLKGAKLIQLEVQIQDYNEGAPRIGDVIAEMSVLGFRVYDIVDFHYSSKGMLIQTDLLFAPISSDLFSIRPLS